MSSWSCASSATTQGTPHTSDSLRPVARFGVIATTGGFGRSRATRIAVDPELVQQMIADNSAFRRSGARRKHMPTPRMLAGASQATTSRKRPHQLAAVWAVQGTVDLASWSIPPTPAAIVGRSALLRPTKITFLHKASEFRAFTGSKICQFPPHCVCCLVTARISKVAFGTRQMRDNLVLSFFPETACANSRCI
jgi:hypothetical protein